MPEGEKDTESVFQDRGPAALIVNTRSRTGERAFFQALDHLQEMHVPLGVTYPIRDPARLPEAVQEVLGDGYEFLILGGGDGTVSSVVDFLADRGTLLGLLPLGTANDFARTLDIPEDIEEACKLIANGKVVDIDLGLAGDNFYVNVASVGLSVEATRALSPWLKKSTGPLAYPVAAIRAFLKHEPFSARLTFPEGDHEPVEYDRLLQVAVGNGRFYGGGMIVALESGIDDKTPRHLRHRPGTPPGSHRSRPLPQERGLHQDRRCAQLQDPAGQARDGPRPPGQHRRGSGRAYPARLLRGPERPQRPRAARLNRRPPRQQLIDKPTTRQAEVLTS